MAKAWLCHAASEKAAVSAGPIWPAISVQTSYTLPTQMKVHKFCERLGHPMPGTAVLRQRRPGQRAKSWPATLGHAYEFGFCRECHFRFLVCGLGLQIIMQPELSFVFFFSRMRSRRVPVLRLGSRGPGGDARSLRLCSPSLRKRSQASASVRKRPQASASVCKRPQAFASVRECRRVSESVAHRRERQIVAKRRTVVTFYVSYYKSVNSHRDRGASSSQNAELSSLLDSSPVFASQKCQQSQGSRGVLVAKRRSVVTFGLVSGLRVSKVSTVTGIQGGPRRKTQKCRHFWTRPRSSRLKSVNSHRDPGGVLVAKRRTVVTVGLVSGLRVSKVSTVTGIQGGPRRKTQKCRHFWTRPRSSRLKSVNSHRDPGGSSSQNAELSSLLDSSPVFASQKCQQSQGSRGVLVAKRRSVVTFGLVSGLRVSKVSTVTGIREGPRRKTQKCRHFWTRPRSSRLKSVNSYRDRGVLVAKRPGVRTHYPTFQC